MDKKLRERLEREGFVELRAVYGTAETKAIWQGLNAALGTAAADGSALRSRSGVLYAARNLLRLWSSAASVWRTPELTDALGCVLGPEFGLVRALFFDKPPIESWALPWHKDLTIAVRDNRLPSTLFLKPTRKAGLPHVEAPLAVLERMLTVRIHLDPVTDKNGPLKVVPGSHRSGKSLALDFAPAQALHARRGDVLLMRPLLAHCSGRSAPGVGRHRRIMHLEFAASRELPDGYAWHDFVPLSASTQTILSVSA